MTNAGVVLIARTGDVPVILNAMDVLDQTPMTVYAAQLMQHVMQVDTVYVQLIGPVMTVEHMPVLATTDAKEEPLALPQPTEAVKALPISTASPVPRTLNVI